MTFRVRILLALAAVALAPVAVVGWLSDRANREELLEGAGRAQARAAAELANGCEQFVLDRAQGVQVAASYIPFDGLSRADLRTVLAIPYRQFPDVTILAAIDRDGTPLADPVAASAGPGARGREAVTQEDLDLFGRRIPLQAARTSQIAVGPPYRSTGGAPRVAFAARTGERGTLVAELSLGELERRARELAGADGAAFLVDGAGEPFANAERTLGAEERALVAAGRTAPGGLSRIVRRDGAAWLASYAPVATLGWGVVLAQPGRAAFRAADRVRRYTLFWAAAAVVLAVLLGTFLARGLADPVHALSRAARAVTEGRYDASVDEGRGDELGQLGAAFNHMAREVARRDEEIRRWNAELQARVEEKTAELREAHEQVARSRQLAAMGSLAAGVAHGLNNPMTSVVGLVSIAREEVGPASSAGELLGAALEEARRVTRVVEELRRLSAEERGEGERRFAPAEPVRAALDARRAALLERGIELDAQLDASPLVQGDPGQVAELVGHLVENAAAAMPSGGRLGVALAPVGGGAVRLTVSDTGSGIPAHIRDRIFEPFFTTSTRPGAGLGLTRSHAIVDAHHGAIHVDSEEGRGTRFTVVLPAAAPEVHLS